MAKRPSRSRPDAIPANVAVAWYDPVEWAKLKEIAEDAENLDESYQAWRRGAEKCHRELRRRGIIAYRQSIDVGALVAWCESNNLPINSASRAQYAAELALRSP